MKINILLRMLIPFFLILFSVLHSFSQAKTQVGLNLTVELLSGSTFVPGGGMMVERQVTRHSGIESGIYFRSYITDGYVQPGNNFYAFSISERYLSIPVLYKYYSRIVNFSIGPSFDYFLGWKQKSGLPDVKVENYSISPAIAIGIQTKLSKPIILSNRFILEPELRFNPIISTERSYLGIGIAAKYKL